MTPLKRGSKYAQLHDELRRRLDPRLTLKFDDIETILGQALPRSARAGAAFWSNRRTGLQSAAWLEAGYRVTDVDVGRGQVTFERPGRALKIRVEGGEVRWDGKLVRALRRHLGLNQAGLARELGVRQQTISEWESEVYLPTRARSKHLALIAERSGFEYGRADHLQGGVDKNSGTV